MAITMDARAVVERVERALNAQDVKALEDIYSENAELLFPGVVTRHGRAEVIEHWKRYFKAFPDVHGTVERRIVEGNTSATELRFTGTNTGPLPMPDGSTLPPTGKQADLHGMAMTVVEDSHIVRDAYYFDEIEMLTQLGLMPSR